MNNEIISNPLIVDNSRVFKGDKYRISVLTERLVRLEYSETGEFTDHATLNVKNRTFKNFTFDVRQDETFMVIKTKYFELQYYKNKPFKASALTPGANLNVKLNMTDKQWYPYHAEVRNIKSVGSDLEDLSKVDLQKSLYSTEGFALLDDSETLEVGANGQVYKNYNTHTDWYLFMYRRDFGLCLSDYYGLTGYPSLLPRYALGIWWSKDQIYSYAHISSLINTFKKNEIPLSVILLNEFWHIKDELDINKYRTGFTFNKDLFPDPAALTSLLHDNNIRLGLNIDPSEGVRKEEEYYNAFASDMGIVDGATIPFNMYDPKFVNSYFKNLINPLNVLGTDFYFLDYKNDLEQLQMLNYYHYTTAMGNKNKRLMLMTRNPLKASHRYSVLYSGETIASWDTLKYLPSYNSGSSNMGISHWSHAVGGYKLGTESDDLYIRNVQFACFSPIFRFDSIRGLYYKREPWNWDIKTYMIVKNYCNLRHRLVPYLYTENFNYHRRGLPLVQPLYYLNPELIDEPEYASEYYFGTQLLVAPIVKPKNDVINRSVEKVFIPKGTWYDFKTGKKFAGDKRYMTFFKDEDYPVFVKAGGIIPLAKLGENLNDLSNPNELEIHIFPGESNTYILYEDDGVSNLYNDGYYVKTSIDYNYLSNNYTVIIRPVEGKNEVIPSLRNYTIRFRNTKKADNVDVYINSDKCEDSFNSYVDDNDFVVEIKNVDTTKQLTINCKGKDIEIDAIRIINEDINSIINDLEIKTSLKEDIAQIFFDEHIDNSRKRIKINQLRIKGLEKKFIKMFLKLLEYIAEI